MVTISFLTVTISFSQLRWATQNHFFILSRSFPGCNVHRPSEQLTEHIDSERRLWWVHGGTVCALLDGVGAVMVVISRGWRRRPGLLCALIMRPVTTSRWRRPTVAREGVLEGHCIGNNANMHLVVCLFFPDQAKPSANLAIHCKYWSEKKRSEIVGSLICGPVGETDWMFQEGHDIAAYSTHWGVEDRRQHFLS